ncbi:uncharacterized protein PHALS_03669 [Plasmopara halstedii]|uniref:Uncharacterized protein n=1 Tax=Plasmopara halstedii TaxID=4781 RepID=A0A0N7L7G4_PLAHL|nr:uncharacterized protein PHALS_03669 [Plasmopara halstedii]CEG47003.1 hypothetical protein PHALS_03669 [Plasmopara halstedii]|eukprot:XP_024583372.1 hypothetical protein PHALS_03669 [Plasmopara halstedii]
MAKKRSEGQTRQSLARRCSLIILSIERRKLYVPYYASVHLEVLRLFEKFKVDTDMDDRTLLQRYLGDT